MRDSDTLLVHVQDIATAFRLLSRLPLPGAADRGARSAWAWPLVGAAVGAIGAAVAAAALAPGLSPELAAASTLAATALATGALHEDGLADTADGLWGGWTPARRLEIMKDSQIGSYGVLALILVTLARWSALAVLLAGGQVLVLIAVGALSRAPMAVVMAALPPARTAGLSHGVGRPGTATALLGCLVALAVALLSVGLATLALAGIGALAALAMALVARTRIGGQTGDILGAAQVLAETAMLAAATVLLP